MRVIGAPIVTTDSIGARSRSIFESGCEGHTSDHIRDNLLVELLSARAARTATDFAQVWRCSSYALAVSRNGVHRMVMTCIGTREALHRDALCWCSFPAMLRVRLCCSCARRLFSGAATVAGTGPEPASSRECSQWGCGARQASRPPCRCRPPTRRRRRLEQSVAERGQMALAGTATVNVWTESWHA